MGRWLAAAFLCGLLASCATTSRAPDAVRADLAPKGVLRGGMNLGNTLFTNRDASGRLYGVSVDLIDELGRRLGVPVEHVVYATPGEVADDASAGKWDVAVLAIEQARAQSMFFSPPMTEIEATYLVMADSPLRDVAQVDAPGVRIAVADKAGYELYLTRTLRNASLVKGKNTPGAFDVFASKRADAFAGLKPALLDYMPKAPGSRLLDGNFMTVNHGLATPRTKTASAEYVKAFVDEMVASGFIARSIERHRVAGLTPIKH